MCSERPYKPAFRHEKTWGIQIEGDARTMPRHFGPDILTLLNNVATELKQNFQLVDVSNMNHVFIVEDDADTIFVLSECLEAEGFKVSSTNRIEHALRKARDAGPVHLFLLDSQLPDGNGTELVKSIRSESEVGIILVTGKAGELDRVVGLEIGADDYIVKPFSVRELTARVKTVLRRTAANTFPTTDNIPEQQPQPTTHDNIMEFQGWRINLSSRTLLSPQHEDVPLTTTEFNVLQVLIKNPQRVLSREQLMAHINEHYYENYERNIDGIISRLRKKIPIQDKGSQDPIKTVRGVGYMFTFRSLRVEE